MPGQTPNFHLRYPLGSERADIRALEDMANDIDTQLDLVKTQGQQQIAGRITPVKLTWAPAIAGMVLGTGYKITANAWRHGEMVELHLVIAPGTGTHLTSGQNPSFGLPLPAADYPFAALGYFAGSWLATMPLITSPMVNAVITAQTGALGTAIGAGNWVSTQYLVTYMFYRTAAP